MRDSSSGRLPAWPERLAALITVAEHRPFDAVRWNCGRFAMAAVVACTGQRPSWHHCPTMAAMADTAGFPRVPLPFARAGDVVLAADPDRLGVVLDRLVHGANRIELKGESMRKLRAAKARLDEAAAR